MAAPHVVVLGGGVGGMVVASQLRERLGEAVAVTLVDRECRQMLGAPKIWIMLGRVRRADVTTDVHRLERWGVRVLRRTVTEMDPAGRRVVCGDEALPYDYLVVALGAQPAFHAVSGMDSTVETYYTPDGAERLYRRLDAFEAGRIVVAVAGLPYLCPAAPYEGSFLLDEMLRERGLRDRCTMDIYTPEVQPMPAGGAAVRPAMLALLRDRDIGFHPNHALERVDASRRRLLFAGGTEAVYDLLIVVPPFEPPDVVARAPLAGPRGWIPVDRHTLQTQDERVWAVGDVTGIPIGEGRSLPKAAAFAEAEGIVVSSQIAARIRGGDADIFAGVGACYIETGAQSAGYAEGHFFAEGGPQFRMEAPSAAWMEMKHRWVEEWLSRWRG
jgi:sulfide:quinone oxidoreductase